MQTPKITTFENAVYQALSEVPPGRVTTYGELARAIGRPRALRAVGNALHKNPYAPKVPCHRVVNSDGRVGQYAQGAAAKIRLLESEGISLADGKVQNFAQTLFRFSRQPKVK